MSTRKTRKKTDGTTKADGPNLHEQRDSAKQCREYVVQKIVHEKQTLSVSEVAKQFGRTAAAVKNDVYKGTYAHEGNPVGLKGQNLVFDPSRLTTVGIRKFEDQPEKSAIGQLGAKLVTGPPAPLTQSMQDALELKAYPGSAFSPALIDKFEAYFTKAHRLLILDSGTTTLAIAEELGSYPTPDPSRNLNFLRVLTNGRKVAQSIVEGSKHGVILLGGALRRDTEAVSGLLSERCLDAWLIATHGDPIADVAIIGTTNVDSRFNMFSDSETESELKSRLLNSARIRIVCATSKKWMRQTGGSFAFCKLSPNSVDLVLSDDGVLRPQANANLESKRQSFLKYARQQNVPIAIAPMEH